MTRIKRELTKSEMAEWDDLRPKLVGTIGDKIILRLVKLYANLTDTPPKIPCSSCNAKLSRMRAMIDAQVSKQTGTPRGKTTTLPGPKKSKPKPKVDPKNPKHTFREWEKLVNKKTGLTITGTGELTDYAIRKKKYTVTEWETLVREKCKFTIPEPKEKPKDLNPGDIENPDEVIFKQPENPEETEK